MAAAVISGVAGAVDGVGSVRGWEITYKADTQKYADSSTQGGTGRVAGPKDWSGSYDCYGTTPTLMPGDTGTFAGSIDGTTGATGAIIVDSVAIKWDIEGGKPIGYTTQFSGNGDLTLGASVGVDATTAVAPPSIGCKITVATPAAQPSYTEVLDVRTIDLTITRDNKAYSSSSTSGGVRRRKGVLDCTLSYSVYPGVDVSGHTIDIIAPNSVRSVRLYTSETEYWELMWMMYGEASGIKISPETAEIVGATQNAAMAGFQTVGSTPTVGSIKKPGGSAYWPAA